MKAKTLLVAAAALAAATISSQAQVYSQNVVGYVNVVLPAGQYALVSNPLDDGTNTTTSLGQALANKSVIQVWNGTGFTATSKVGGVWTPDLSIPVGAGFFVNSKTTVTNTFVGSVVVPSGQSVTNALSAGIYALVGSAVPYAGDLNDTNVNIGPTLANKSVIQVWNGSGFDATSKVGGVWTPNLTIGVGQGFFVLPKTATNWVQVAP